MYIVYANIYSGLYTLLASAPMLSITHDAWQSVFRRIVQVSQFRFSNTTSYATRFRVVFVMIKRLD